MFAVHRPDDAGSRFTPRLRVALVFVLAVQLILAGRLWYLQLVQGESYVRMARENRVRLMRLPPSRGRILDSTGRVIAGNRPGFTFSVIPGELTDEEKVIEASHEILGTSPEDLRKRIDRSGKVPKYMNYALKKNMTLEEVSLIQSRVTSFEGVALETKPLRRYPKGESLCHVVGTIGEVSRKELAKVFTMGYRPGDLVGKTGIEKEYENALKGEEGWEQIEIDAKGRQLRRLSRKPPVAGADISLTVDVSFQRFVEEAFPHRAGSVIAVDPDTGRILAMVSKPGFDLKLFTPSITTRDWKNLNRDTLHPFENRSIRGLYSPASAFKAVMAAAALAEKRVSPEDELVCSGKFHLGGQTFRCWNRQGHGKVDLRRSLVESCDTYYYNLALKLGPELIAKYASLFGLGKPTGLGLPQELPGLIPTPAWKLRSYGEGWKDGETVTVGIGQSYLVCTPIQMAMMTAALANGGKLLRPSIVRRIQASDGRVIFEHTPVTRWELPINPAHFSLLREFMIGAVEDKMGTGKKGRIPGITVAGKTGTSQVVRIREGPKKTGKVPYHERTHAIFVAYVDDMPEKIAVVVIVEHGGSGGTSAAPIARKVIARYYGLPDPGDAEDKTN